MPDTAYDLKRLAALVKVKRPAFADIFDPLAKQHKGMDLKLIQVLYGAAPPGDPEFLKAFEHAYNNGWVEELVRVLLAAGALRESEEPDPDNKAEIELHKVTRPLDGFPDAARDSAAAEKARQRVCKITVKDELGRPSYGTGFLVGPQTVLTNWHVIRELLDPNGRPKEASWRQLEVTFDLFGTAVGRTVNVAEDWLVCHSLAHDDERGSDNNAFSCIMATQGFEERLDFAVIRLQQAEGRARGYYQVSSSRQPAIKIPVIVFQHPGGGPLARTGGIAMALWPDGVHTRLRHDANTIAGSSGGLVLDNEFELVALHQAGIKLENDKLINAAIPTYFIALNGEKNKQRFDEVHGVDPMWCIASTGFPVFGRLRFQELLLRAVTGLPRILIVRGPAQSGVSFSREIMKDRLGLTEHRLVEVSARELPSDATELAKLILKRCGADEATSAEVPLFDTADTTIDAWLRDVLLPDFMNRLLPLVGPKTLWLILDDLDRVELPATSSLTFLRMLLQAVLVQGKLRIVLLGQNNLATFAAPLYTAVEDVALVTREDVERTISIRARQNGIENQDFATVRAQADLLYKGALRSGGPFLSNLVKAYSTNIE